MGNEETILIPLNPSDVSVFIKESCNLNFFFSQKEFDYDVDIIGERLYCYCVKKKKVFTEFLSYGVVMYITTICTHKIVSKSTKCWHFNNFCNNQT